MTEDLNTYLNTYIDSGSLKKHRQKIYEYAKNPTKWIPLEPLDEVATMILLAHLADPRLISGELLGVLAHRLIDSEVEIGGPYLSRNDTFINILIARIFYILGSPLKNLDAYLNKKYIPKTDLERKILIASSKELHTEATLSFNSQANKAEIAARFNIEKLNPVIAKQGSIFLEKIIALDTRKEISQLSNYILKSLTKPANTNEQNLADLLGSANIHAWIAYTIYDDIIDNEGDPLMLSLANIMQRISYDTYITLFITRKDVINTHFNSVDNSNLWELQNTRCNISGETINIDKIPEYGEGVFLAERSVGHVLGPILLIDSKYELLDHQKDLVHGALFQYLIARQISDDLKDWRKDLHNGHVSYVVSKLLKSANIQLGTYNLKELTNKLQKEFWMAVFEECSYLIISKISTIEDMFAKSGIFKTNNEFSIKVLQPLKAIAESDLFEYSNSKDFLKSYSDAKFPN